MMQRDLSPFTFPNTYRDSNEIPQTPQEFVLPSTSVIKPMDLNSESRHSIIEPVESDNSPSPRIPSPSRNRITNKPLVKSIVRPSGSDDERPPQEQPGTIFDETLINDNDLLLEAAGYDPSRLAEIDADAAYALQLQQEEYTRESLMANQHPYLPFQVEQDDELTDTIPPVVFESDAPPFMNDEQLAAYLQEQENRKRNRYRQPPIPFVPIRQRSNPVSSQTSETDEIESEPIPAFRFAQRQPMFNEDDDDDDESSNMNAQAFLHFLANHGRGGPEGFPPFFAGFRRAHRRTGNLQDTEEDFGPEDYERLLQLDDTIRKKKLTKDQINLIPQEHFHRTTNNSDEENKCGVCLEFFEENQTLRRFPCRHVYHKECGDRWLQENNVCPICREPPVKGQVTSNFRPHRGTGPSRRPSNNHRNPTSRNNNNNNNNNNTHHRRGPAPHHQS